ncbi:hypothetical protein FD09_GL002143 [Schleiferilactobacillus perolens DSM 12744]|uniref:DUF805 domain-containing protein n=2 Tax=Schleiferilactobacillus perolens TaxID=100468 RepID=A0A0R1N4U3_9LACO|nr:hypothetical protein FD09_GL002143 [Schleiferilactobacillus perolens DSM 12744]
MENHRAKINLRRLAENRNTVNGLKGMEYMQSIKEYFTKMFVFSASATRKQFWIPYFAVIVITVALAYATGSTEYLRTGKFNLLLTGQSMIFGIYLIVAWIANFTIRARRLHDTNRSNWWIFIVLVPLIGGVWLLILFLLPSKADTRWPKNQSEVQ